MVRRIAPITDDEDSANEKDELASVASAKDAAGVGVGSMDLDELASEAGSQSDAEEDDEDDDDAGSDFSESPAVESRTATPKTRSVPSRASTSARRQSSSTAPAPASISNEAQPKSLNGGFKIKLKVNAAAAPSPKTAATTALPSFRFGQATHPTVSAPVASTSRATPSTAPSLPAKRQRKQAQVDGGNCPLSLLDHLFTKLIPMLRASR